MDMASFNEKTALGSWLRVNISGWLRIFGRCALHSGTEGDKGTQAEVHDAMRAQVPVAVYPMVKR